MFDTDGDNSETGRLISLEMRIVAAENQTLPPVGLVEHFARHPFSLAGEFVDKSIDGSDDCQMDHSVGSRRFDILSDGFGKQPKL